MEKPYGRMTLALRMIMECGMVPMAIENIPGSHECCMVYRAYLNGGLRYRTKFDGVTPEEVKFCRKRILAFWSKQEQAPKAFP